MYIIINIGKYSPGSAEIQLSENPSEEMDWSL